jgi:hypothetical protein
MSNRKLQARQDRCREQAATERYIEVRQRAENKTSRSIAANATWNERTWQNTTN